VAVERKRRANPEAVHHSEGNAVGKTDLFVRIFPHPANRFDFVGTRGGQHLNAGGGVQVVNPVRRVSIPRDSSEQRSQLIDNVVARRKRPRQGWKNLSGLTMVLVALKVESQKSAGVDEDQILPPYR
jgi:hypothetical protein